MSTASDFDTKGLPNSLDLPRARIKAGICLVVSLAMFASGILMVRDNDPVGWLAVAAFGLSTAGFAWTLFGESDVLLDRDGLIVRWFLNERRYCWKNLSEFSHARVGSTRMILFNDFTSQGAALAKPSCLMLGHNTGLATDFIGGNLDEACVKLNAFRSRALGRP